MKIWHISDTHGFHNLLEIPEGIDIVVHSGDWSDHSNPFLNEPEALAFLKWFEELPIKYKMLIAGNHDTAVWKNLISKHQIEAFGIMYLEDSGVTINGINFWGSPWVPVMNPKWAFQKKREKMFRHWDGVPTNTHVLITHTPPKSILDSSWAVDKSIDLCGCRSLMKQIIAKIRPDFHLFGHIHSCKNIVNTGTRTITDLRTVFSNGSVVTDGKFGRLTSNGNVFDIHKS